MASPAIQLFQVIGHSLGRGLKESPQLGRHKASIPTQVSASSGLVGRLNKTISPRREHRQVLVLDGVSDGEARLETNPVRKSPDLFFRLGKSPSQCAFLHCCQKEVAVQLLDV